MIKDDIKKTHRTMKERGIPNHSYFGIDFHDGSSISEHDHNWTDMSEQKVCEYFGKTKTVNVSKHKIKKIQIKHGELEHTLVVPDDCEVYQAIRSQTTFYPNQEKRERIVGRVVGLVKNGKVVEEYFLNDVSNEVQGMKS